MRRITKIYASLTAEIKIIGANKLARTLAVIGFCNGILISGLILFVEWRRFNLGGRAYEVIVPILFPTVLQLWEFEGGKTSEIVNLLLYSIVNGCLYAIVGLLISNATRFWHQRMVREKV